MKRHDHEALILLKMLILPIIHLYHFCMLLIHLSLHFNDLFNENELMNNNQENIFSQFNLIIKIINMNNKKFQTFPNPNIVFSFYI
jgi:hypothetical protein